MLITGGPFCSQKEIEGPDFGNGWDTVQKKVKADQRHTENRNAGGNQKYQAHHALSQMAAGSRGPYRLHKFESSSYEERGP